MAFKFRLITFKIVAVLTCLAGCKTFQPEESSSKAQSQNRFLMGLGVDAEIIGDVSADRMQNSMAYRRKIGWKLADNVISNTSINTNGIEGLPENFDGKIPRWVGWYDAQEFQSIAAHFFSGLQKHGNQWKSCLAEKNCVGHVFLDAVWNHVENVNWDYWGHNTFERMLAGLKSKDDLNGMLEVTKPSGATRKGITLFSPALVRHYLENFLEVIHCDKSKLTSSNLRPGARPNCFANDFPKNAIAIKTTWNRRTGKLKVYDTSSKGLKRIFKSGNWNASGTSNQGVAELGAEVEIATIRPKSIFTMVSRDLGRVTGEYVLTGIHIMSRETKDWTWVSMWWSPNANADFGSDRPEWFSKKYDNAWSNYKMCVSGSFVESDRSPWIGWNSDKGISRKTKELLETYSNLAKESTWCSNPYIETTPGHARTNCIGCHQHAGTKVIPSSLPNKFPSFGRSKVRETFPGDYLWSFDAPPDKFTTVLKTEYQKSGLFRD